MEIEAMGSICRAVERQFHHHFSMMEFSGSDKTTLLIKWARPTGCRDTADPQLGGARPAAYMLDQQFKSTPAKPQPLIAGVDHKAPEKIVRFCRVIIEHEKADRRLIGINGAEPGMFAHKI